MKQNKFKVRIQLKEYVRNILSREGIPHRFRSEEGQLYCIVPISGMRFHKIVKRAYCEQQTEETGLLHLTYEESQDVNQSNALMKLFHSNGFVVVGENKSSAQQTNS